MEILEPWGGVVECKEHAVWGQMMAVRIQAPIVTNHLISPSLSLLQSLPPRLQRNKYSSTSGLSPRGHLERQAEFHASTQDEA